MKRSLFAGAALCLLPALLVPLASSAAAPTTSSEGADGRGVPGRWTTLNTGPGTGLGEAALLRTADGRLHVVHKQVMSPIQLGYVHSAINPAGTTVAQSNVDLGPVTTVSDFPKLGATPTGGMRIVTQADFADPLRGGKLVQAVSNDNGATWGVGAEALTKGVAFGDYGHAAAYLPDGTTLQAFILNSTIGYRTGTVTGDPALAPDDSSFSIGPVTGYNLNMIRYGDTVWAAWHGSGATDPGASGIFVRQLAPTLGPIMKAPRSEEAAGNEAIPMVVRPGGGLTIAYSTGFPPEVALWQVGTPNIHVVPQSEAGFRLDLATDADGRLYVTWIRDSTDLWATHTARRGWKFGPVQQLETPRGDLGPRFIQVDAQADRADLVLTTAGNVYHSQFLPGLSLKVSPAKWRADRPRRVKFTVTDAGRGVAGALVKAAGERCRTTGQGTCTLTLGPRRPGAVTAKASKASFEPATKKLRLTRR